MTNPGLKSRILKKAEELGIDLLRFTEAAPLLKTQEAIRQRFKDGTYHDITWNERAVEKHIHPALLLKDVKTLFVAAECYLNEELQKKDSQNPVGRNSPFNQYNAYWDLRDKLHQLKTWLEGELGPEHHFKIRSNYRSIAEKEAAVRAGLGWYGKNGLVITPEYGSLVAIGVMLTDLEIETDQPLKMDCGSCDLCLKACPTQAIAPAYVVRTYDCLQYISERPYPLQEAHLEKWGTRLYGCSTCQDVCPHNHGVTPKRRKPEHGRVGEWVELLPILQLDDAAFKEKFKENQIGIRERKAIQRNAIIALGHSGDRSVIRDLEVLLHNPDQEENYPYIRWAINRLMSQAERDLTPRHETAAAVFG